MSDLDFDAQAELESAIIGGGIDTETPLDEQEIDYSSDQATQWLAELALVRRKKKEVADAHAALLARVKATVDARNVTLTDHENLLEEVLTVYHEMRLVEDPDGCKTIVLPTGTLSSRMGTRTWVYQNEDDFEAWAVENVPAAVTYPEPKVSKAEVKKVVKDAKISDGRIMLADGTTVPGVLVLDAERSFKVKTED